MRLSAMNGIGKTFQDNLGSKLIISGKHYEITLEPIKRQKTERERLTLRQGYFTLLL